MCHRNCIEFSCRRDMWKYIGEILSAIRRRKPLPQMSAKDEIFNKNISFMESISEAIPQLILSSIVLRSYGLSSEPRTLTSQICSIGSSFLSLLLAFGLVSLDMTINH